MVVGGHVEPDETQAEAAVREATEKAGLRVRLLTYPQPRLPAGLSHTPVPQQTEMESQVTLVFDGMY